MKRKASAQWRGNLKEGQGVISSESGSLNNLPYSFLKRFGDERGTNPEELIGAAHSSCYAMALSAELQKHNITADTIDVQAEVSLTKVGEGWEIPDVSLMVRVSAPGTNFNQVREAAQSAKENCPISKLLRAKITMDFQLHNSDSASMQ